MTTELINKIAWQSQDGYAARHYALCPTLGVIMVSFQVQGNYQADLSGQPRGTKWEECAEVGRRLVACWNACAGLSTESLERSDILSSMNQQRRQLEAQRDQLLKALLAAIECGMVPKSSAREGGAMAYAQQAKVADMIRDAIAACQPAPAVAHLPSNAAKGVAA